MNKNMKNNSGASLVATVLTLLIFVLFLAIAVSLVTTGTNVAVQEEQGLQALFIADGGLQYTARRNNFPNYGVNPAVNFGRGSFTVSIPTLSVDPLRTNPLPTLTVSSTEGFTTTNNPLDVPANQYWIMLCVKTNASPPATPELNAYFDCEKISFTGITATTFTTGTRGRDSSSIPTAAEIGHPVGSVVLLYSWSATPQTTLSGNHNATTTTINVSSTAGFAQPPAFIRIHNVNENRREDILYRNMTATSFTNCIRGAYDGGVGTTKTNNATVWQSEISVLPLSTGIIQENPLTGNIQRKAQLYIMPLK